MMEAHGRVCEYLDGALTAEEEDGFLTHLAACPACEAELHDELQLRARLEPLRTPVAPAATESAEARPRTARGSGFRSRRLVPVVAAVMLAAAIALVWMRSPGRDRRAPVAFGLAPTRAIEPRLAYAAAAAFRAYDVPRGATPREHVSAEVIARLDRARDCHGVAAAYVLNGEYEQATTTFERCGDGPDLDADRAALSLLRHQPESALRLADRALASRPQHLAARWNRALALRDLGLGLAAAEAFGELASEPGWGVEANVNATALRRGLASMRDSWARMSRDSEAMVLGGPVIELALARRHPGKARVALHDALRTARTAARVEELRPLARALEGLAGTGIERYVELTAARWTPSRVALIDEYAALAIAQAATPGFDAWVARARKAGADDLVLGGLLLADRVAHASIEATRLAAATGDAWFELAVTVALVNDARSQGRFAEALALLDAGDRRCAEARLAYRCLQLTFERAAVQHARYRTASTLQLAASAMRAAETIEQWPQRASATILAGDAARFATDYGLARAFYREATLAADRCGARRMEAALDADMRFDEHRIEAARDVLRGVPPCDPDAAGGGIGAAPSGVFGEVSFLDLEGSGQAVNWLVLVLEADLAMAGAAAGDLAQIRGRLDEVRTTARPDTIDHLLADYLRNRIDALSDPAAIERLRDNARTARTWTHAPLAPRIAAAAEVAAIAAAGRRGAWADVVAIAAEHRGAAPPTRCALVLAADDFMVSTVAVGARGELVGAFDPDAPRPTGDWQAPPALQASLRDCAIVDVIATPSWFGVGPLLGPGAAWRYALGPGRSRPSGPTRAVVVAAPTPPTALGLAPLAPWREAPRPDTVLLSGRQATPERVASELADATLVELHAHSDWSSTSDAPVLALSEGANGWALSSEDIAGLTLIRAPIVLLADCSSAASAPYRHAVWGLPAAFLAAGASSVIASLEPIPDGEAGPVFARLRADLADGIPAAVAVARLRAEKKSAGSASWTYNLVVFE